MLLLHKLLPGAISENGCSSVTGEFREPPEPHDLSFDRELQLSLPFPFPGFNVCLNPSNRFLFGLGDPKDAAVLPVVPSLLPGLDLSDCESSGSPTSFVPAKKFDVAGKSCFRKWVAVGSFVDFERGCDCVFRTGFVICKLAMSGADLKLQ